MELIWLAPAAGCFAGFRDSRIHIRVAESVEALPGMIRSGQPTALVIDTSIDLDRESACAAIDRWRNHLPVWIFDPAATVASSLRWMKEGAAHVALAHSDIEDLVKRNKRGSSQARDPRVRAASAVGDSPSMAAVEERIRLVADRRCTVLIEGETGTGKEVAARAIHAAGARSRGPWVAVNCGAIPEALLEAELFGYVKGAFTGAVQSRAGKFEAANRGTIFLDEIGDMPLPVQGKLLRVLQEREVERLGGNENVRLDVRVIAATNCDLARCVREGSFRQDLFYRLNVFRIALPPLRERAQDIPALALHFVEKVCAMERLSPKVLDPAALEKLTRHSWPGNVRELENTIEAAVICAGIRAVIFPCDINLTVATVVPYKEREDSPLTNTLPVDGMNYERVLGDFEKSIIAQALVRTRGNKTAAASLLGLKRTTLSARMRALESRLPRLVA